MGWVWRAVNHLATDNEPTHVDFILHGVTWIGGTACSAATSFSDLHPHIDPRRPTASGSVGYGLAPGAIAHRLDGVMAALLSDLPGKRSPTADQTAPR